MYRLAIYGEKILTDRIWRHHAVSRQRGPDKNVA